MKVGKDYRFPNYQKLMWYAARDFLEECSNQMLLLQKEGRDIMGAQQQQQQQQVQTILCAKYSPHILRGYNALAKELERWSSSKEKWTIEQYPEHMDVKAISTKLGSMMKLCVAHL